MANPKNNKRAGRVRLAVLVILLANQALVSFGYNPLPFSEEQIYGGVSALAVALSAIYTWYRNNNVTKAAEEAQVVLEREKANK